MTLKYMGETERNRENRIALASCKNEEEERLIAILDMMEVDYQCMSADDVKVEYYFPVDDEKDFNIIKALWKECKKLVRT